MGVTTRNPLRPVTPASLHKREHAGLVPESQSSHVPTSGSSEADTRALTELGIADPYLFSILDTISVSGL